MQRTSCLCESYFSFSFLCLTRLTVGPQTFCFWVVHLSVRVCLEQRHFLTVDFYSSCMLASLEAVHRCVISDVWMYIYRQRDICSTCIVDDVSVSSICSIDSPLSSSVTPSLFHSRLYLPFLLILPTSLFFFRTEDWPTCCAAYFPLNSWLSFQRLCRLLWG